MVTSFKHGTLQDKFVERLRSSGRLEDSPDSEVLFRKLKEGRIDGIFSQSPIYKKYIGDLDMAPLVDILDWTPGEKAVVGGMVLSKHRFTEADAARWRAALQSLRDDGTLKAIYSKYVTAAEAARLLDF
jgi:polar amino acid transport system substrate-binding protein